MEPPLPPSIEQDLPIPIEAENELDTAYSDESAATAAEGSSKVVLDADATGGIELQSEIRVDQETLTPSAQETRLDVISSKDAPTADVAHEVKTEVEVETHGTDAATTTNDLAAVESPESEQLVIPTTEVFTFYFGGNSLADPVLL